MPEASSRGSCHSGTVARRVRHIPTNYEESFDLLMQLLDWRIHHLIITNGDDAHLGRLQCEWVMIHASVFRIWNWIERISRQQGVQDRRTAGAAAKIVIDLT